VTGERVFDCSGVVVRVIFGEVETVFDKVGVFELAKDRLPLDETEGVFEFVEEALIDEDVLGVFVTLLLTVFETETVEVLDPVELSVLSGVSDGNAEEEIDALADEDAVATFLFDFCGVLEADIVCEALELTEVEPESL
jgi:hypothetical protein